MLDTFGVGVCIHNICMCFLFLISFLVCHASSACVLSAFSCFTHLRTWSPVISSVLLMTLSSLSIFLCIYSSLMPQINCSFTCLSSSWYLYSSAAILNCLIHSSTFSLLSLSVYKIGHILLSCYLLHALPE